jgi:hypothetical protein
MLPLDKDLQQKKTSLSDFVNLVNRILGFLPSMIGTEVEYGNYILLSSSTAGNNKAVRPINKDLFIRDQLVFAERVDQLTLVFAKIRLRNQSFLAEEKMLIDSVIYTIQQAIGAGFDLLVESNSARKHVGNRFEELIKVIFTEITIPNKKVVIKIPYASESGITKNYTCENDLILSPFPDLPNPEIEEQVILNTEAYVNDIFVEKEIVLAPASAAYADKYINEREVVVSVKTTSKDRMGKMFMDKILLQKFVGHDLKVIGIFLNDVQRKGATLTSFTLVSGLFMVYNQFITELSGVYYLDPPPAALNPPYSKYIKRFSQLITEDLQTLLTS